MTSWVRVGAFDSIDDEDVLRFDHAGRTFAVYRYDDQVYATDGRCTHEQVHLADGLLLEHVIECPKHNGRFDIRNGKALRAPACVNLVTYPAKVDDGVIYIEV